MVESSRMCYVQSSGPNPGELEPGTESAVLTAHRVAGCGTERAVHAGIRGAQSPNSSTFLIISSCQSVFFLLFFLIKLYLTPV